MEKYNLWELYNKAQTPLSWHKELLFMQRKKLYLALHFQRKQ